ncbi:hypothetical protein Q4503_09675 [Colwellia sp. 6_MG-2023]|uniref:hypothetical protein n=1 Tax=Colwellia sp. 6_MG-2023 TaxID=3062676 RepID=UPI0026E1A7B3|nr:hypothetical protein [Colwellia sp. 6_MG-2023]MDO6487969.1 hypothetical protein [Colwellia sp. 6_MG-2023]
MYQLLYQGKCRKIKDYNSSDHFSIVVSDGKLSDEIVVNVVGVPLAPLFLMEMILEMVVFGGGMDVIT